MNLSAFNKDASDLRSCSSPTSTTTTPPTQTRTRTPRSAACTNSTDNEGAPVTRDTIKRTDGRSWAIDGYRSGTLFTIDGGATFFKVNAVVDDVDEDTGDLLSSALILTLDGDVGGLNNASHNFQRMAYAVSFDATNWWQEVKVVIEADPNFVADPDARFLRSEPVRQHLVSRIAGPLIIEGGVAEGKDRSVKAAVMLPTETTAAPKDIAVNTDETKQADRLNVFNDSSTADDKGWMSSVELNNEVVKLGDAINLSGLGMRPGSDGRSTSLAVDISEAQDGSGNITIPGGITFDDIEITEVLLGQGNDTFNIDATSSGTPGASNHVVTVIHGGGNTEVALGVMGGDHVTVTGGGGSASPLVLLGDTFQDGARYDSRPDLGIFTGNALFFANHGNDVIDASASDGAVTIYGGRGNDVIHGSQADDQIAGGSGNDTISGEGGDDHIYADSGFNLDYDVTKDEDTDNAIVARLLTVPTVNSSPHLTADAVIVLEPGANGNPIERTTSVIRAGSDIVHGNDGADIIFGDHGVIDQLPGTLRLINNGNVTRIITTEFSNGAADEIFGDAGVDRILGGNGNDDIQGNAGQDIIFGDHGRIDYEIAVDGTSSPPVLTVSISPTIGGIDTIQGNAGNDIILGGAAGDVIKGGNENDLIFGDFGSIEGDIRVELLPLNTPVNQHRFAYTSIFTQNADGGGSDLIYGDEVTEASTDGDDIIIAGQAHDVAFGGGANDDLIGGHNVAGGHDTGDDLDGGIGVDVITGDNAQVVRTGSAVFDIFRTLSGSTLYNDLGDAQVTATPQANPTGALERFIRLLDHSFTPTANTSGDDYIAGGAGEDRIFGQLGNDVIQGDGSILTKFNGGVAVSAASNPTTGLLTVNASFEASGDGDDYIEGNGGNDTIFGNLGQDDIIGGSSSLFGLTASSHRPDGSDILFGGAGTRLDRNHLGKGADSTTGDIADHGFDADYILGDNGNVYRPVTLSGGSAAFLTFNYDTAADIGSDPADPTEPQSRGPRRLIPRAYQTLDYTPGIAAAADNGASDFVHGEEQQRLRPWPGRQRRALRRRLGRPDHRRHGRRQPARRRWPDQGQPQRHGRTALRPRRERPGRDRVAGSMDRSGRGHHRLPQDHRRSDHWPRSRYVGERLRRHHLRRPGR